MEEGKLIGRVGPSVPGLLITTSTAVITDLGTEFGVVVKDYETELHVFDGAVMVLSKAEGSVGRMFTLHVGDAIRLREGTPRPIYFAASERHFSRDRFANLDARAEGLLFNFDDGTLQGWTNVMVGSFVDRGDSPSSNQTAGIHRFDVILDGTPLSSSTTIGIFSTSGAVDAQAGDYRILPTPFYSRDANTSTLLLRSPEFKLDGSGDLTAWLISGDEGNAPPTTSAGLSSTVVNDAFQGIALRRVNDDTYVLLDGKSSNGNNWEEITFSQAALTSHVSVTETYTLDLIDSANNSWGNIGLDSVSVPGVVVPEPHPV